MNKKKITALFLLVAVLAAAVTGVTLAYFTDTDSAVNTFTVGDIEINLYEIGEDGTTKVEPGLSYEKVLPGVPVAKAPYVENIGSNDAYVRLRVRVYNALNWFGLYGNNAPAATDNINAFLNNTLDSTNWTLTKSGYELSTADMGSTVYFILTYNEKLAVDGTTSAAFSEVVLPTALTEEIFRSHINGQSDEFSVEIHAEAIQADGFANATAAFDAFDAQNA